MKKKSIRDIRAFSRFYTDIIGLLNQHLLDSPWSLAEARLMYEIHAGKTIQPSQIMEIMHIDKSYLSRLLKKLEKENVITKKQSGEDARAVLLTLTAKGAREFEALNKASDEQIGQLLQPLADEQAEQLVLHMKSIMAILKTRNKTPENES
jgi:DNA-binding MarR family transcriptional regulator